MVVCAVIVGIPVDRGTAGVMQPSTVQWNRYSESGTAQWNGSTVGVVQQVQYNGCGTVHWVWCSTVGAVQWVQYSGHSTIQEVQYNGCGAVQWVQYSTAGTVQQV
jgi:hypothetical protein